MTAWNARAARLGAIAAKMNVPTKPHELPEGYASHAGLALVRLPVAMPTCLTVAEMRAWMGLIETACVEAEDAVEQQRIDAERDAFDGVPDEPDDETQRVAS